MSLHHKPPKSKSEILRNPTRAMSYINSNWLSPYVGSLPQAQHPRPPLSLRGKR
jgi:hypothetical protein